MGVTFSPAGLLTPYHLGVAARLRERGFITAETALAGASGGALAAAITALEIPSADSLEACSRIARRCRDEGTYRTLALALNDELESLIPLSAADTLNSRPAPTRIAYTEVWPSIGTARFASEFASRQDVLSVLIASCTIPFYFSGSLSSAVRGASGCDGFFAMPRERFGCPETFATDLEIIVSPFDPRIVGLQPRPVLAQTKALTIISPALLPRSQWPFTSAQLVRLALAPPPLLAENDDQPVAATSQDIAAVYAELFAAGRASVDAWERIQ